MAATLTSVSEALKKLYLGPIREQLNTDVDPFASRIERSTEHIVGNQGIVRSAQVGLNGGFGAGTETGATPTAGENIYKTLNSSTKNLYGVIEITDKLLRSVRGNDKGSFANLVQREIDTMLKTAKWHFARMVYGTSDGKLCTLTANNTASTVVTVSSTQFLIPGITVDVVGSSGTVAQAGRRILDIDLAQSKVTLSGTGFTVASGDFLTVQGSYQHELTGLGDIFNTAGTTLYGLTRASNSWLNPLKNTNSGAISNALLLETLAYIEDHYNSKIDIINSGTNAYKYYMELLESERRQVNTQRLAGGVEALTFNGIPVVRNKFVQTATMQFLDTSLFTFDEVCDWDWIEGETGGIFQKKQGYASYSATLAKYADLMCVNPGGIAMLAAITAPA